jgi:PAS domain S-box-containing protein
VNNETLLQLAFNNVAQANLLTIVSSGKIVLANNAAGKLTGYSKRELLNKSITSVFTTNEISYKKMLRQRDAEGQAVARVKVIKKSGEPLTCEITSAVFTDEDGIKKAITTIAELSQSILKQKEIDTKKHEIVESNIIFSFI